jgi:hypothetical protein
MLKKGVDAWNDWRQQNPDISLVDLSKADLTGANLSAADLQWANLNGANLVGANLNGANLVEANLSEALLSDANLGSANLSSANCTGKSVEIDGAAIGQLVGGFSDYDSLVEQLRERIGAVGISYRILEEIGGFCEGAVAKYLADARVKNLSIGSLLQIAEAIGVRGILVTDERLLRKMRPLYEARDTKKVHARRRAKLGAVTLKRVRGPVLSELGKQGAAARNRKLGPETRRALAQAAARARWAQRRPPAR